MCADTENSVKNGAELLDRLVKDIVSESAASYVSVVDLDDQGNEDKAIGEGEGDEAPHMPRPKDRSTAFSLARFIPLLQDRITVLNPYTRMFLVTWITLLDSIPDLELVTFLPSFLGGLFKFLTDTNQDVRQATQQVLDKLLHEIKKIAQVKKGMNKKRSTTGSRKPSGSVASGSDKAPESDTSTTGSKDDSDGAVEYTDNESAHSGTADDENSADGEEDWIPGQDVQVDHAKILDILVTFLGGSSGECKPTRSGYSGH